MTQATLKDSEVPAAAIDAKAADRRAILAGAIVPTLMRLALPTITVLIAQTMVGIAETYYVGRLGTDALVGTSVVFPIWMLMTMTSAGGIGGG
jgi:Na+-driven multidrug efflux pump